MGNSGRQAATGRRLAALQQRISSVGAPNVRTGKPIENHNSEAGEDTPSADTPPDSFPPFPTPTIRRAGLRQSETKASLNTPLSTTTTTPPIAVNPWSKFRDLAEEGSSQPRTNRDGHGGSNKVYNIASDNGGIQLSTGRTFARLPVLGSTTRMSEGLQEGLSQDQDQQHVQCMESTSDRPDGNDIQATRAQTQPLPDSKAKSARGVDLNAMSKLALDPGTNYVRVSKSIRRRKRNVESKFKHRDQEITNPESTDLYENIHKQPHTEADPVTRQSSNANGVEVHAGEMHNETALGGVGRRNVTAPATCSPKSRKPATPSHIPAPSLSFKTKKLRRRFDASVIEAQLGIELSPQNAERLRALSGNDLGTAINLYLQGCCNASESQSAAVSSQTDKQDPGRSERQTSSGPVSPMDFWQQRRQTEKQAPTLRSEGATESPSQGPPLSEDQHLIAEKSEQECAEQRRGPSVHDVAEDTCLLKRDSGQLVHQRLASEELGPQTQHQHGHCGSGGSPAMGDGAADDPGNLEHTVDSAIDSDSKVTEANDKGENSGTGPVPLRGMQAFTNQENVRPRNPPTSTGRLPNGKLGMSHLSS
jgi:hypothetical protein